MLIEKSLAPQDVITVKMSNGDEIICKLAEINEKTLTVTKPLLMILAQDPSTGFPGVQMAPFWMMGADPDSRFPISRSHVQCAVKAGSNAMKKYMEATTGLAMPGVGAPGKIIT